MHKLITNNKTSNCPKKEVKYFLVLLNLFSPTCQNHHLSYYPRKKYTIHHLRLPFSQKLCGSKMSLYYTLRLSNLMAISGTQPKCRSNQKNLPISQHILITHVL